MTNYFRENLDKFMEARFVHGEFVGSSKPVEQRALQSKSNFQSKNPGADDTWGGRRIDDKDRDMKISATMHHTHKMAPSNSYMIMMAALLIIGTVQLVAEMKNMRSMEMEIKAILENKKIQDFEKKIKSIQKKLLMRARKILDPKEYDVVKQGQKISLRENLDESALVIGWLAGLAVLGTIAIVGGIQYKLRIKSINEKVNADPESVKLLKELEIVLEKTDLELRKIMGNTKYNAIKKRLQNHPKLKKLQNLSMN